MCKSLYGVKGLYVCVLYVRGIGGLAVDLWELGVNAYGFKLQYLCE